LKEKIDAKVNEKKKPEKKAKKAVL